MDVIGILGVSNFEAGIFLCNGSGQASIDELAKLLLLLLIKLNLEVSVDIAIRCQLVIQKWDDVT